MNTSAEKHLAKAQGYLEKGDGFYRKAAEEIVAAKAADPTLGDREIGKRFGRGKTWVGDIVRWYTSGRPDDAPFSRDTAEAKGRGAVEAKRVLREAPMEQIEQIIADLPRDRQKQVAAAAGHEYLKARVDLEDEERNRTPAERKEREAAADALADQGRRAASGFASLGIAGHIDQATDELRELVADASLGEESLRIILRADAAWRHELQVAAAMVGLEVDLQEVGRA